MLGTVKEYTIMVHVNVAGITPSSISARGAHFSMFAESSSRNMNAFTGFLIDCGVHELIFTPVCLQNNFVSSPEMNVHKGAKVRVNRTIIYYCFTIKTS